MPDMLLCSYFAMLLSRYYFFAVHMHKGAVHVPIFIIMLGATGKQTYGHRQEGTAGAWCMHRVLLPIAAG